MKEVEKNNGDRNKVESQEDLEIKEAEELIEWMKKIVSSYKTEYIYFVGELKDKDVYISHKDDKDDKYIPKYVKAIDFIYVIKNVTDRFNKMEKFRAVSVIPKENRGKIECYVYNKKESSWGNIPHELLRYSK